MDAKTIIGITAGVAVAAGIGVFVGTRIDAKRVDELNKEVKDLQNKFTSAMNDAVSHGVSDIFAKPKAVFAK